VDWALFLISLTDFAAFKCSAALGGELAVRSSNGGQGRASRGSPSDRSRLTRVDLSKSVWSKSELAAIRTNASVSEHFVRQACKTTFTERAIITIVIECDGCMCNI